MTRSRAARSGWLGALVVGLASSIAGAQSGAVAALRADLKVLAADSMAGRLTGSRDSDGAAAYLARRFAQVGARPGVPGWRQEFVIAPDVAGVKELADAERPSRGVNVVAVVDGRDPRLRDQAVVVGAHYDHLGLGAVFSQAPDQRGQVHNGADDNASGTVALLEIARRLAKRPPRRSVVLVAFSGEELGLLGSTAYVRRPAMPLERTFAMINLDMVGRLRHDRLLVFGSETAVEFPALLDSLNRAARFDLKASGDGFGRSDQQSFYVAGKPVLHLFTDLHEDYHRPTDDWEKINIDGLVRVAGFATELARSLGDRETPLTFVSRPAPVIASGDRPSGGYGAYLGSIPDMSAGGPGVRLSGVRSDSPAARAGLREGDVLIQLGRHEIADLQAMTDALRSHQPGDTVIVVFRRGGATDSTRAVLARRGG